MLPLASFKFSSTHSGNRLLNIDEQHTISRQKQPPRWNFKKDNWTMFQQRLDNNCRKLDLQNKNLNEKMETFGQAVLEAPKHSIPRGSRSNYTPGWRNHLQQVPSTLCTATEAMEENPSDVNVADHNQARTEYTRERLQQQRTSWHEKTQSLSMDKDTKKLW